MSKALCPPIGHQIHLQGKISSENMTQFRIEVSRCNTTTDPTCLNDTMFQMLQSQMKQFVLGIPMVNTQVNPESQQYKKYFYDDLNGFSFTDTFGTTSRVFVQ